MSIKIQENKLQEATGQDMDAFLAVFTDAYLEAIGGSLNEKNMTLLNGMQHSLLAYHFFREEVMQGGFISLIQNGYGSYIFRNPFAPALKTFGADELSKLIYKARKVYDRHQEELERETTEEEFTAMYEEFEVFDEIEERFFEIEEECTQSIARFVDEHLDEFGEIVSSS
ncbi:MAG TPA: DMP19 family protein [Bacteroidales bacterium]|nr:DMP19 family protein [Bacteroidales bacterium]